MSKDFLIGRWCACRLCSPCLFPVIAIGNSRKKAHHLRNIGVNLEYSSLLSTRLGRCDDVTDRLVQMTFLAESRASQQLVAEKYALEKLGHLVSSDLGGNPTPCQLLLSTPALSSSGIWSSCYGDCSGETHRDGANMLTAVSLHQS